MKILLVEDDPAIAAVLTEVLTAQHYTVDIATDGQIGLTLATSWEYELVLLDLLIPKLDGINLCRQLRSNNFQKPILLLTAKDSSADVVQGLDAGADDYVTKPYDLSELLARIRALLRRGETNLAPTMLSWEKLSMNPVSAEVFYDNQALALSPKEYGLLGLFLRNPQRVFSRSDIIDRLWSIDASPSEGTVTNLIKDLRQKLKAVGMSADLLETVYGLGYRLKAPPNTPAGSNDSDRATSTKRNSEASAKPQAKKGTAAINRVLERYQDTFASRLEVLEQAEQALRSNRLDPTLRESAAQEAHKLTGVLGSFGYETGSTVARAIEHLLIQNQAIAPTDVSQFSTWIAALKQALAQPPTPLTVPLEPPQLSLVLAIDESNEFTEQLQTDAIAWGFQIQTTSDPAIVQQLISETQPQAILLNLGAIASKNGLAILQDLKAQVPTLPIVVITEQDSLSDRVVVSRLGVQRFLHQPISTADVCEALTALCNSEATAPGSPKTQSTEAKVLIVDDDAVMLKVLRDLLQPWGIQVTTLQDPRQFWTVLTTTKPDLLVMDLEMPEFSGIDLCKVVRQDAQWGDLPILVVTAHTDLNSIQQVFAAGADDFIGKPVAGPELVTRVICRLDRDRLQQELEAMKRRIGA